MNGTHARRALRGARARRGLLAALAIGSFLAGADAAQARTEVVRWRQPDPVDADGFRIHIGTQSRRYDEVIDVGALTPSSDGTYAYSFQVPDASTKYVAVSAYNEAGESALSNEAVRGGSPSSPSTPSTPSTPPAPSNPPAPSTPAPSNPPAPSTPEPPDRPGHSGRPGSPARPDKPLPARPPRPTTPPKPAHPSQHGKGPGHSGRPDRGDTPPRTGHGADPDEGSASALRVPASGDLDFSWTEEAELKVSLDTRREPSGEGLELRGRMRIDESGAGIGVTLRDPERADVFYWLGRDAEAAAFDIGSTFSEMSCVRELPTPVAGVWYRFRFAILPGEKTTVLSAKVWESGTREPDEWAGCLDQSSDRLVAVVPGLWGVGPGVKAWSRIKVKR